MDLVASLPLPLGVLGHEGSTVLVGLNGLRLLSDRAWRPDGRADGKQAAPQRACTVNGAVTTDPSASRN